MTTPQLPSGKDAGLLAISDLHVSYPENRRVVECLRPHSAGDWLIVCGDVSDASDDVEWALRLLAERFAQVIWVPGNHELWTLPNDPLQLRGVQRYEQLVELCRGLDVLTPEDPYPLWEGAGGPTIIAPLFLLYDYSFGSNIAPTKEASLARAHRRGVVCSDEFLLHPDPHPSREAWCEARLRETEPRLAACDPGLATVLINHFPLIREPTLVLRHPEFAQWCGTTRTADWHRRFRAKAAVYGHLHIPRVTWHDGVKFDEVSLRYQPGWDRAEISHQVLRRILPIG